MRLLLVAWLLAMAAGCEPDRRKTCDKVATDYDLRTPIREQFVERCVRERWTRARAECLAKTGDGSFMSMFCND